LKLELRVDEKGEGELTYSKALSAVFDVGNHVTVRWVKSSLYQIQAIS
jgi:hypothetical protein